MLTALVILAALLDPLVSPSSSALALVEWHPAPVITTRSPGAAGIKYGFEGGRVVKVGRTYHLFTSEMVGDPVWVRMKLAHWHSDDKLHWTRAATLFESSAEFDGQDPRAALWSPLPVYEDGERRWNLFYVAYRAAPNTSTQFRMNQEGRYIAVYDTTADPDAIGYSISTDGIHWPPGQSLVLQTTKGTWSPEIRTPLGLVAEHDGTFTVFYTGFEQKPDWTSLMESKPTNTFAIGFARVKIVD